MLKINFPSPRLLPLAFFGKAFKPEEGVAMAEEVIAAAAPRRVVMIDTAPTAGTAAAIRRFLEVGIVVVLRDHHDVTEAELARGGRAAEIRAAADEIRGLLGEQSVISTRQAHPACSGLIEAGEFASEGTAILADADLDGLTAAMKAVGLTYTELDSDAAVFDGPRAEQAGRLSPLGELLAKGMATVPPYDKERPEVSERAKAALWSEFVSATQGDAAARAALEAKVVAYEEGVAVAKRLAASATEIIPGVWAVDTVGSPRFDGPTLYGDLDRRPGCRVTVARQPVGVVAKHHGGIQYVLSVVRASQAEVDLRDFVPAGVTSSPEAGVVSNQSFKLTVSEKFWEEIIIPALRSRFGG